MESVGTRPRVSMSGEAKSWLSTTVRNLRERLLKEFRDSVESTYRLGIPLERAGLSEEQARKRERLKRWLAEQVGGDVPGAVETEREAWERYLQAAVKLAAATFLNRLVALRQMETLGMSRVKLVTGGFSSPGYRDFCEFAPGLASLDGESREYALLLRLKFDELALDLPGMFGDMSVNGLIPIPPTAWRSTVEALEAEELSLDDREGLWRDDTLLGWIYQFWNDPEREALDEKLRNRGKIETHEIAAKTQLFTDRYMVEWLLQNSLGQTWFAICEKNGWTAEVASDGTLDRLESQRSDWREKRDRGEVSLEALMPLETEAEECWKYWVRRDLPEDAAPYAPTTLRELKLLDPACGSGHFLVGAFNLLAKLYEEEARHRGEDWSPEQIACWIIENNLHGIDIDARAVQIAATALWMKVKAYAPLAEPRRINLVASNLVAPNLVASNLHLGSLPKDDPALVELEQVVAAGVGMPPKLTRKIVEALEGSDHLGTLLKMNPEVEEAILEHEEVMNVADSETLTLSERLSGFVVEKPSLDLALRLRVEQLAAGIRYIRMLREGQYDLVVGNPPYQNMAKANNFEYLKKQYPEGKADLYSAFLLRAPELTKEGGITSLLTLRGWMFLGTFEKLRQKLLNDYELQALGDIDRGGFELVLDEVVSVVISVLRKAKPAGTLAVAQLPTPREDKSRDARRTARKRAALLAGVGHHEFSPSSLNVVPGQPLIYWWDESSLDVFRSTELLGDASPAKFGINTGNNTRFLRRPWETLNVGKDWVPYIKGAQGRSWYEPLNDFLWLSVGGLELKTFGYTSKGVALRNPDKFFCLGVAFSPIGTAFSARLHRFPSVTDGMGSSVYSANREQVVCLLNSQRASSLMSSLNPTVHFQVGDVNRLPLFPIESADEIVAQLDLAFTEHEQAREASVEFKKPGPTAWEYAQSWAQQAVDRPKGEPLPPYAPVYVPELPEDHLSFALGVALGRFDAHGDGILNDAPLDALPHGILFLSSSGGPDGLDHPGAKPVLQVWEEYGAKINNRLSARHYLRDKFFKDDHLKRYEKRPIYFPLSSEQRSFVAWCSIHRWHDDTLQTLLAEYLQPELSRLSGELADLGQVRTTGNRDEQARAQSRYDQVLTLQQELQHFVKQVAQIAERGAPPADPKCPPREQDARFKMDLDDGVMVNSAGLWPLLEPQWKDPKAWWKELCTAKGRKDYDWAHLAARYFPARVDQKCQEDPSLAVAHGCFWKYHPEKAHEWELRLQAPDELGPAFKLDEEGSDHHRRRFLEQNTSTLEALSKRKKDAIREEPREDAERRKAAN